jgi:hypothetical protein
MCNKCDCENSEKCSIVGYQPYGACCSLCVYYDEAHTCPNYKLITRVLVPSPAELFQTESKERARAMTISIERYP